MDTKEISNLREILAQADFAHLMPPEKLEALLPRFYTMNFGKGELIMQQGMPAGALVVIATGSLEVFVPDGERGDIVLNVLTPVNYVGEMALMAGEVRNASVRAREDIKAYMLGRAAFEQLLSEIPLLKGHFQKVARKRRQQTQKRVAGASVPKTGRTKKQ